MLIPGFTGTKAILRGVFFVLIFSVPHLAQTARPSTGAKSSEAPKIKVTLIDEVAFKRLLIPKDRPLLINFWATWCDPCREEFPDLVTLDTEYKGKIDFITVSLDDPADIATTVPKFLSQMKAEMPAYLLKTPDESAVIFSVSKDWRGGMPFTALYSTDGKLAYFREGKVVMDVMRAELVKLLSPRTAPAGSETFVTIDYVKIKDGKRAETLYFYENNWKLYREEALKRGVIHSYELLEADPGTSTPFDLILITRYTDAEQHKASEKNFEPILKMIRPNGPAKLNSLNPDEFRQSVFVFRGRALFSSAR